MTAVQIPNNVSFAASEGAKAAIEAILQAVYVNIPESEADDPLDALESAIELMIRNCLDRIAIADPIDPDDEDGIAGLNPCDRGAVLPPELSIKEREIKAELFL